jgi:hypothetical protein
MYIFIDTGFLFQMTGTTSRMEGKNTMIKIIYLKLNIYFLISNLLQHRFDIRWLYK